MGILTKIFGTKSDREIKKILPMVKEINEFYDTLDGKDIGFLQEKTKELQNEIRSKISKKEQALLSKITDSKELKRIRSEITENVLKDYIVESFALVKHACKLLYGQEWLAVGQKIKWEMIPYDEQIIGGLVLHDGKISEMKTGEGKTLVATFPIYLNALSGRGVHVITVNDYLAQRDAEWMGRVFETLGLSVGFILNTMNPEERKSSYACDITYGTNNEFGFDYLRDNMTIDSEYLVQRKHNYAIVDEVDSVLIDEARTPLIISGPVESKINQSYIDLKRPVQSLVVKQTQLVNSLVSEANKLIKKGKLSDEEVAEAGLLLLKAKRGLPKDQKLQDLFNNSNTMSFVDLAFNYQRLLNDGYNKQFLNKSLHSLLVLPFFLFLMTALAACNDDKALRTFVSFSLSAASLRFSLTLDILEYGLRGEPPDFCDVGDR